MSKLNEAFSISELKSNLNSSSIEIELLHKEIQSKSVEQINLLEKVSKLEWDLQSKILYTSVLENELGKYKNFKNNSNFNDVIKNKYLESEIMKEKLRSLKIKDCKRLQEVAIEKSSNKELMEKMRN